MTYTTITQKVLGSDTYAEKKILATDVNQIREAIQTGVLDIKPYDIHMEGNTITADAGQNWIRRSSNKFQFYDAGTWKEPAALETASFTAGEDIAIRDVVYVNTTDGKIYKCDSDLSATYDWIGIAKAAISSSASGEVYLNGSIVGGFSSLTPGEWYKISSTAGSIIISDQTIENVQYNIGIAISSTQIKLIKNQLNGITHEINSGSGLLGEIRPITLSLTGSLTKSQLQGYGWAICDGTTPTAQGITSATITTTPDLQHKFLRMSNDESSSSTGGTQQHNHQIFTTAGSGYPISQNSGATGTDGYYDVNGNIQSMGNSGYLTANLYSAKNTSDTALPPYYEIVYFIKVK